MSDVNAGLEQQLVDHLEARLVKYRSIYTTTGDPLYQHLILNVLNGLMYMDAARRDASAARIIARLPAAQE